MDKSKNGVDKVEKVADRTEGWIELKMWRIGEGSDG